MYFKKLYFRLKGYSPYHAYIAAFPDAFVTDDFIQKTVEMHSDDILKNVPSKKNVAIAVLGCADARYLEVYETFFGRVFGRKNTVDVYDLTTKHLPKLGSVHQHDCCQELPKKYDIIYSHLLLNFLPPEQQALLLSSAQQSLKNGGLAIHLYASDRDARRFQIGARVYGYDPSAVRLLKPLNSTKTMIKMGKPQF